jgi:RHS repeat-associated protein
MNFILNFPARSVAALLVSAIFTGTVVAQVGSDNPTGTTGAFNGSVTTGGSYDPYTANATRSITDLDVAGTVGAYPLAFTRTMNSRYLVGGKLEFGPAGTWSHNFQWSIPPQVYQTSVETDPEPLPSSYSVDYPDGRRVVFNYSDQDSTYRGFPGSGISDRFEPLDNVDGGYCYLLLPDGGKIQFAVTVVRQPIPVLQVRSTFTFKFMGIVDPHGQFTSVTYPPDGSMTVQEPAGRQLKLFYAYFNGDTVLQRVEQRAYEGAPAARSVQYYYVTHAGQTALSSVVYFGDSNLTATYTYQNSNINAAGRPLLSTADDPMYAGPMRAIAYEYATGAGVVHGQIQREKHPDGTHVSSLSINGNSRTETRGDGPQRTFNYSGGKLVSYSDFKGQFSFISYDANGFQSAFTDARGKTTATSREPLIGALSVLTHPDPEQSTRRFAYRNVNGAPYFLEISGDERHFDSNTYFVRDPVTHRVTKIWYPDYPNGPTEEFTYNNLGQVETHTMTSGGVENFRYDSRGLMYQSWPPATPSDLHPHLHPTQYFYHTNGPNTDRLQRVQDPRGNSTSFEYNTRGQVTKVTHQDGSFRQMGYNPDGTLAWAADENHPNASWNADERTRYTYDDYKRVLTVKNPMNETTTMSYALDWVNPLVHTTRSIKYVNSPLNKNIVFDYDENFRKIYQVAALNTADEAWTLFQYDAVGNLTSVQDPRGNVTTFAYDNRNRRISSTAPYPFQSQIIQWEYDTRSNLIKEIRPDQSFRRMEYDALSRVVDTYGFANEHTHYERDLAGNVMQMIDPKPATYFFGYDAMNRKISATYPIDATATARTETWRYDWAGNLDEYKNPAGQVRTQSYDSRNRPWDSSWNAGGGPLISTRFDAASRLASVETRNAVTGSVETTVTFGYDDANRQTYEEQTVAGFPTRRVETPRDADGNRSNLHVPGFYLIRYDYTWRNQLRTIYDGNWTPWFNHLYDAAGNMTRRQDVYGGVNDSTNIVDGAGVSQYDAVNRPMLWEQTGAGNAAFARSHFSYDNLGRLTGSWRDEQGLKGEWFGYNTTGQLTDVRYNADGVSIGNPQNASRTVNYTIAPNTLNRVSMNDNGEESAYTPNGLNQYENVGGGDLSYDEKFNLTELGGFNAWYDSANRLRSVSSGENQGEFIYDGLGRCLKRTVDWETILIAYDGWKPIVEWDEWHGLRAWNIYGAGPDEILYRYDAYLGVHLRYHADRMGNVAFLLDSAGNGIERYTYDAFGYPTVTDWNGENPRPYSWYGNRFMFTGREYFAGLGIYDYRNRFYHPILGRFLQSDPIGFAGGDANLFRYCGGDPINRIDPSGLGPQEPLKRKEHGDMNWAIGGGAGGRGGQGISTQGFWGRPDGTPTSSGAGFYNGGYNGGGSWVDGAVIDLSGTNGVHLHALPSFFVPNFFSQQFRPGEISTLGLNPRIAWRDVTSSFTDYYVLTPLQSSSPGPIATWVRDHISGSINLNVPAGGGNVGVDAKGVFLYINAGPGAVGELTATVNFNFGNAPSGIVVGGDAAIGHHLAGRISGGWSTGFPGPQRDGGFYFNGGIGYGHAAFIGGGGGSGGYIYTWDPND